MSALRSVTILAGRRETLRLAALVLSVASAPAFADTGSGLAPDPVPTAGPSTPDPSPGPVATALALAAASGQPVTVTSQTTQTHELIANPDGSLSSVDNPLPVRVQQSGTWVGLNATLAQNSDGTWSPAATPSGIVLSDGGTGPLATLTDPAGHTLSYALPFTLPTPAVTGSTALYSSVLPGVDLSVSVTDQGGFSEVLIVHNATAAANPDLAKLTLAASTQGLTLSTDAEGDLDATTVDGSLSFTAPQPVMWDSSTDSSGSSTSAGPSAQAARRSSATAQDSAAGSTDGTSGEETSSSAAGPGTGAQVDPVALSVSSSAVTLTPDQSLLTGTGTAYPVFIDPETSPASASYDEVYSNSECSGSPQFDKPQTNGEGVGYNAYADGCGTGLERSFYTLPLTGIPSNAVVSKSVVTAPDTYAASWNCSQDQQVTLHTTGSINSGTDWNNQPGTDDSDYSAASATVQSGQNPNSSCSDKDASFIVTTQVQKLAAAGVSSWTVGLFGTESPQNTSNANFLRFSTTISIDTTFDAPPNPPTDLHTVPNPINPSGANCNNTGTGWIGAVEAGGVTFYATVKTTMAGENLKANFDVSDKSLNNGSGVATVVDNHSSGWVSSGTAASTTFDSLQDGHTYDWAAQAEDDDSSTNLTSAWVSQCHFAYDATPPATPAVTTADSSFPQLGTGTPSTGYAGTKSTLTISVSATDPLPAATCTMNSANADACQASGIDHFIWKMDGQPTVLDNDGSISATSTGNDSTGAPTASATVTAPVPNWGVHNLYVAAVDKAGNISQAPTSYTFYAPWNPATKITPGDISGDGIPDLLTTTQTGDLDMIQGATGPDTAPVLVSPAADSPTGANSPSEGKGTWNDYWIAHRGSLTGGAVDDLFAYDHVTHDLYGIENDLDAGGGTNTPGFTEGRVTDFGASKPACNAVTPASRCASVGYDASDWDNVTQITAPGDVYNEGFADLITIENGQLWLYKGISGPALSTPVLLGDGDWSNFTLISPGTVAGAPTLWARDKTTGNLYSFNISPIGSPALPPLLHAPNTTVTQLISGVAASGGGQLCLADPNADTTNGTDIIIWSCENNDSQSFSLAANNTVHIMGKCLEAAGSGTANGTAVDIDTCNGTGSQTWTNGPNGSLVNPESGKCLADPAASTTGDTGMILWTCDNGNEQNWNNGSTAALPTAPTATSIINIPTSTFPNIASPGDVNGPISTSDPTGAPDSNPDLYVIDANGQLIEYPGAAPTSNGTPTFAGPVSLGTVTNTAVHAWSLADGSGTTAADSLDTLTTPNPGLDTTLVGGATWNTDATLTKADPTLTTGTNLQVDGTTGYATTTPTTANPTGTAVNTTGSYTVSLWANLNTNYNPADYYTALCQRDASGARCGFYLQYSAGFKGWALVIPGTDAANTPTYFHAGTGITPAAGHWTHLVGVYDAATGTIGLYVNGHLAGTGTDTTPWTTPAAGPLLIGGSDNGSNASQADFPGKIADVHIYNTALPAPDAAALGDTTTLTNLN